MPPMRTSFIAELGFTQGEDLSVAHGTVVPELCVPETDVVLTSVLLTWADILAGPLATAATVPRVCMTNDLTVRLLARPPADRVDLRAAVLKSGRTTTFTETWLCAAGAPDAPFAVAHGTFVASPRPEDTIDLGMLIGSRTSRPLLAPLPERLGVRLIEPGVAEIGRRDELLNPADTLQGGVVALIAEVAALSIAGGGAIAHTLDVRYLRATRTGPARATARIVREDVAGTTIDVRVVDAGADDRLAAVAVVRCGPIP